MAKDFLKKFETDLLEAQESGEFPTELSNKIRETLECYANGMIKNRLHLQKFKDDLVQEGLITLWQNLQKFRWICPICNFTTPKLKQYQKHCVVNHGKWRVPKSLLTLRLSYRVKTMMVQKAKSVFYRMIPIYIYDCDYVQKEKILESYKPRTYQSSPEQTVISKDSIEKLKMLVLQEDDLRIKETIKAYLRGASKSEVYDKLVSEGFYCNSHSARSGISRLKKEGNFDKYRMIFKANE